MSAFLTHKMHHKTHHKIGSWMTKSEVISMRGTEVGFPLPAPQTLPAWFATRLNFLSNFTSRLLSSGNFSIFAPQIAPQNDAQKAR